VDRWQIVVELSLFDHLALLSGLLHGAAHALLSTLFLGQMIILQILDALLLGFPLSLFLALDFLKFV